jgi:hypothetical protein
MKLRNLIFVSLALLTLATAITSQVHAEGLPLEPQFSDLSVVVYNHSDHPIQGVMGICGSDVHTLDGWEISCKYLDWQNFTLMGGTSVKWSYDFPNGKYTVDVAWSFDWYGESKGTVEARTFRTVDLHSYDQTIYLAVN